MKKSKDLSVYFLCQGIIHTIEVISYLVLICSDKINICLIRIGDKKNEQNR